MDHRRLEAKVMDPFWAGFLTAYAVSITLVIALAVIVKVRGK